MRQLLARRDARIYLSGQLFSLFGDSSLWLAMGIWVKTLTGSNAQAGLVIFFFTAPSLLAPALGLLADRVRRRPLLLAVNTLTAAAVLGLLAVDGRGQVWLIDLVMFAYGLSYGVIGPAQSALLTVMLPARLLPDANAALRTAQALVSLIGPLAGPACSSPSARTRSPSSTRPASPSRSRRCWFSVSASQPRTPLPAPGPVS